MREHDPHRLIFTGDSILRPSTWHQERHNTWTHDTMKRFAEMLTKTTPDPINGIETHAQGDEGQRLVTAMEVACKLSRLFFLDDFE